MKIGELIDKVWGNDAGSPLIDWLVLTCGTVMLAIAVMAAFGGVSTEPAANAVEPAATLANSV
jgi:hypothetical protein